ncbi:MAG TPA: universal stress protein, partial [Bacteroidia bacterium]|nr:universal stress protein [Bacteroidia bacterium]
LIHLFFMNQEKKVIVTPIDFSEQSLIALSQTYNLARLTGSHIRLLHVIDQDFISHLANSIFSKENYADQVRNDIDLMSWQLKCIMKKEFRPLLTSEQEKFMMKLYLKPMTLMLHL